MLVGKQDRQELHSFFQNICATEINHAKLYIRMNLRGCFNIYQGLLEDAISCFTQALNLIEMTNDLTIQQEKDEAIIYHNIGTAYADQGLKAEARTYFDRALMIKMKILEKNDPQQPMNRPGGIPYQSFLIQNQCGYLPAQSVESNVPLPSKCGLLRSYHRSSLMYYDLGDLVSALRFEQEAINLTKYYLGDEHITLAENYHHLGRIVKSNGDLKKAFTNFFKAIVLKSKRNVCHPLVASAYQEISDGFSEKGYLTAAESHLKKSCKIYLKFAKENNFQEKRNFCLEKLKSLEIKRACNDTGFTDL